MQPDDRPRRTTPTRLLRLGLAAGLVAAALAGCGDDDVDADASAAKTQAAAVTTAPAAPSELEQVRTLTAPFTSVDAAKAAGYAVWSPDPAAPKATCPTSPDGKGKMGYHLVNPALRGTPAKAAEAEAAIDFAKPEQLLYQKTVDGALELVGVEYLVFKAAWERENGVGAAAPQVLGQPVPASRHAFAPGGPEVDHYELHVWLHSDNPDGMFAPYHPAITC